MKRQSLLLRCWHDPNVYMCLCSLSPGPRGRLVCFYVVCPLVHPEKGPRRRLVCPLCSLSPGTGVPGEGLFCLHVACLLVFLKRLQGKAFQWVLLHCMGQVNAQELQVILIITPPSIYFHFIPIHPLSTLFTFIVYPYTSPPPIFSYFNNSLLHDCCIPHPLVHYYVLILCVS